MRKTSAFTIAEILIALTIIGIISVLVIPTRVLGTKTKAYNTTFKTAFEQIQQGLTNEANIKKHSFVYVGDSTRDSSIYSLDNYMRNTFEAKKISAWTIKSGDFVKTTTSTTGISDDDFKTLSNVYSLRNGVTLLFPKSSTEIMADTGCTHSNPCLAYIDVNGSGEPNSIIECEKGTTSLVLTESCEIDPNSAYDIFPILIKTNQIYPATNAVDLILAK